MGGMHGFGPVVTPGSEQAYHEPWEGRIFAISTIAGVERLAKGPGGRPVREEMAPDEYLRASYYERWIYSVERRLERAGTIEPGEIERWMERLQAGEAVPRSAEPEGQGARTLEAIAETESLQPPGEARYAVGDRVRVRRMRPAGHTRCPRYVRGATGVVEAIRGNDPLPDIGPYQGPLQPVYAVAFDSETLFGPSEEGRWTVMVDLFEHYLEDA
jgi:nitrile hydratase beta subunit